MTENTSSGFKKITNHPNKDEIVEKLIAGISLRQIESWLKSKYPNQSKLHVSYITLQKFRKNHLNIEGDVLKELQKERKALQVAKRQEQQQEQIQQISTYQVGKANYLQDSLINYNDEILRLMEECREGIDDLKDLNEQKGSHLNHQAIASYLEKYKAVIEMHHKMVSDQEKKQGDRLEEDYEQLRVQMDILIESVKEAFNQTNPEGLFVFMDLVKQKMNESGIVG